MVFRGTPGADQLRRSGVNGIPGQVITRNVHTSTQTRGGLITAGPLKGTQFAPDGTPVPFTYGDLAGNLFQIGGSGKGENAYIYAGRHPRAGGALYRLCSREL